MFKNSFILKLFTLLLTRGTGLILTFAVSLFLARIYGVDVTGKYYLFISILMGLSVITKLGFNNSLIKYCAHHPQDKEKIRGYWFTTIKISIAAAIPITILIISYFEVFNSNNLNDINYELFIYACIALIPFTILGHNTAILIGLNKQTSASIIESIALPALFLLLISTSYYYTNYNEQILAYYVTSIVIVFFISSFYIFKRVNTKRRNESPNQKSLIQSSMPVLGINVTNFLTDWSATYILAIFGTLSQIGLYNISWRLVTIMSILLVIANNINAPQYSKDYKNNHMSSIKETARKTSTTLFLVSLPLIMSILVFAEDIMGIFGNDFKQAAIILQILALGQIVNFATGSVGYLLLMTGHEKQLRNITLTTCIIQIVALLIFIPLYNIYAAAIISSLTITTKNIISTYIAYKNLGVLCLPMPKKRALQE